MRATVSPFLRPSADAVDHAGWVLVGPAGETPLGDDVKHWDYQSTLTLRTAVSVERDRILTHCGLGGSSELAVVVTAHSDHTGTHGLVARLEVPPQPRYDLALEVTLPGHSLGGRLELTTNLVAASPVAAHPLAARRPGSVLWRTRHRTHLEGTAARFPTDAADFAETRPTAAHAGWHLSLDTTDPDASFMSASRLTLNTSSPGIADLLAGDAGPVSAVLLRVLRWDMTRQMAMAALRLEGIEGVQLDPDAASTAGVLRNLLARIWPLDDIATLRARLQADPASVELDIQHHARLVAD